MAPITCRIILVDHASRLPLWEAPAEDAPLGLLTPLDPAPFALWDVSALAIVFQVGDGLHALSDLMPALTQLRCCKCRLCFTRHQDHVLVILEKRERTPVDVDGMRREIMDLLRAAPPLHHVNHDTVERLDTPAPWTAPIPGNGSKPHLGLKSPRQAEAPALPPGVRLLVEVEDEFMVRSVCTRVLSAQFLVFEVPCSLDALALSDLLPFPISVLVSDINLPRMDGITLAHVWRKRRPETRILLLSGNPYSAANAPLDIAFLQKPFLADDLLKMVTDMTAPAAVATRA